MRTRILRGTHGALQTAFAVAAVATAVALPVVLLSVGGGVLKHEIAALEGSGFQITVSAAGLHGISLAHERERTIEGVPSVGAASPVLSEAIDLFLGTGPAVPLIAEGIVPLAFTATEGPEIRGLFPNPLPLGDLTDRVHFANGSYSGPASRDLLVSSPFADALHLSTGTAVTLSADSNRSAGVSFNVTGTFGVPPATLGPTAAFAALLPLSELQLLVGAARDSSGQLVDGADSIEVALSGTAATTPSAVSQAAAQIQSLLPYYGVSVLADQVEQLQSASSILQGFYLALSSVGLTVGLVFLLLVLVRRVDAERRIFGIRRAMGESSTRLAGSTLRWAGTLATQGTLAGTLGGILVVSLLARYASGSVRVAASLAIFDPGTLLVLGLGVVGLSLLAGLGAWRRILSLSIPEVLR
jgi:putative ABC transport system permease protein